MGSGFGISPVPAELAALGMSPFPKNSHLWHQIPHFALPPILPSLSFLRKELSVPPCLHRQEQKSMETPVFPSQIPQEFPGTAGKIQTNRRRGSKSLGTTSSRGIPWDALPKTSLSVTSIQHHPSGMGLISQKSPPQLPGFWIWGQILPARMEGRDWEQSPSWNSLLGYKAHPIPLDFPGNNRPKTGSIVSSHNSHLSTERGKMRSRSRAFHPLPNPYSRCRAQSGFLSGENKRENCLFQLLFVKVSQIAPE